MTVMLHHAKILFFLNLFKSRELNALVLLDGGSIRTGKVEIKLSAILALLHAENSA